MSPSLSIRHWEVFPKDIRLSVTPQPQSIPLSLRGNVGAPRYESSNPDVVSVDWSGTLQAGTVPGNAMIMVWRNTAHDSVRHVAVEVRDQSWFADHPDFKDNRIVMWVGCEVKNALTVYKVVGATVKIRKTKNGPVIAEEVTSKYGVISAHLLEGLYYCETSAPGYITVHTELNVKRTGIKGQLILVSPELNGSMARIILEWEQFPEDLDAHITGPLANGQRFHVYSGNPFEEGAASIDAYSDESFGPETVTVYNRLSGLYKYCVYDYTNSGDPNSMALANSNARVKLFTYDGQELDFKPPNQPGTVWNVFTIDGSTGVVTSVNTIEYIDDETQIGA